MKKADEGFLLPHFEARCVDLYGEVFLSRSDIVLWLGDCMEQIEAEKSIEPLPKANILESYRAIRNVIRKSEKKKK